MSLGVSEAGRKTDMQAGKHYRQDVYSPLNFTDYYSNVWSGTPSANNANNAWNVYFNNGNSNNNNRNNGFQVRLVHNEKWQACFSKRPDRYTMWLQF